VRVGLRCGVYHTKEVKRDKPAIQGTRANHVHLSPLSMACTLHDV
jgi:hypothetical protein